MRECHVLFKCGTAKEHAQKHHCFELSGWCLYLASDGQYAGSDTANESSSSWKEKEEKKKSKKSDV